MNRNFLKLALLTVFIAFPAFVPNTFAVGMGGMGMGIPTPCGGPFPPCPVPLDNGVLFLLIAGVAYGAYKLYCTLKKDPA